MDVISPQVGNLQLLGVAGGLAWEKREETDQKKRRTMKHNTCNTSKTQEITPACESVGREGYVHIVCSAQVYLEWMAG